MESVHRLISENKCVVMRSSTHLHIEGESGAGRTDQQTSQLTAKLETMGEYSDTEKVRDLLTAVSEEISVIFFECTIYRTRRRCSDYKSLCESSWCCRGLNIATSYTVGLWLSSCEAHDIWGLL